MKTDLLEETVAASPAFTGERLVPGKVSVPLFREHEARYNFAARYVKNKFVLDVACGTGIGSQHMLVAGASRCIGLDLDPGALRYAQAEYRDCSFAACDAQAMCLEDEVADVVVSFETIEHVPEPVGFLRECKRILKPGGLLVCSTPNHSVYRWFGKNQFHRKEFTAAEFRDLLGAAFTLEEMYSQQEVLYPRHVLERVGVRLLGWLGLREKIRQILRPDSLSVCNQTHFDPSQSGSHQLKLYVPSMLRQPTYFVAIARKALA